jgi:hypothetical protein
VAVFEWECPSFGCLGVLMLDDQPRHHSIAWCQPSPESKRPFCGRTMRWDNVEERWSPHPDQPPRLAG